MSVGLSDAPARDARTLILRLPAAIEWSSELAAEIEKQSVYVSQHIRRMMVGADGVSVTVEHDGSEDEPTLRRKADRFLTSMVEGLRVIDRQVVAEVTRQDSGALETDVYEKLKSRGWVVELGLGQVALAGPALALAKAIEERAAGIGRGQFGGIDRHYPTLIPTNMLARCGYITSFPQHLTVVSHLREDFEAIETFRQANVGRDSLAIPDSGALEVPRACLCPALCYHCYPTLAGRRLSDAGHVETALGRVCRYESSNITGLDRLWEFTQRSIIWVGGDDFCVDLRQRSIDVGARLAEEWDVGCTIETASDPFFAAVTTAKSFWQRSQALKFELRATVEPHRGDEHRTIAAASFNLHGTFFGEAFDIADAGGAPACSGCACWGLERWVLVLFTQHGFDAQRWPAQLRQIIFN
jgi:seryl-tRNA synthetase